MSAASKGVIVPIKETDMHFEDPAGVLQDLSARIVAIRDSL